MDKSNVKSHTGVLIFAGVILASLIYFSPGSILIFALAVFVIVFIRRIKDAEERKFILRLFVIAFAARILFTLILMSIAVLSGHILNYYPRLDLPDINTPYWIDDSGYYTLRSQYMNMYLQGLPLSDFTRTGVLFNPYGGTGYMSILTTYFNLFGYSPVSSRFINCLFGSVTVILIYYLACEIADKKAGRIAAVLAAFFPSLFFWSTTNLKETGFILSIYMMLFALIKLVKTKKLYYGIIVVFSIAGQCFIRSGYKEIGYLAFIVIVLYLVYVLFLRLHARGRIGLILLVLLLAAFGLSKQQDRVRNFTDYLIHRAVVQHSGMVSDSKGGGKSYELLSADQIARGSISSGEAVNMAALGFIHFMLQPFPWRIESLSLMLSFPQMLLWYALIVFFAIGALVSLRRRARESGALLIYFVLVSLVLGVSGGNIGTTFRFRDSITPIVLIFASVGMLHMFCFHRPKTEETGQ